MQQGPTLTMSPAFDNKTTLPRSHSSPHIPDLVNFDHTHPPPREINELPRSASFTTLPALDVQYASEKKLDTCRTKDVPVEIASHLQTSKVRDGKLGNKLQKEERPKLERVGRRKSLVSRPKSWMQRVKGSPERRTSAEHNDVTPSDIPPVPAISKATRESKTKTVSESFATFARKSWMSSSRSPSPNRRIVNTTDNDAPAANDSKMTGTPITSTNQNVVPSAKVEASPARVFESPTKSRRISLGPPKFRSRPQSVLMNFTPFKSTNSSTSSLPRSSTDERSTPRTSTDKVPPLLKNSSSERIQNLHIEIPPRRRDELWSAFRSMENEFSKFQSKSWSLKTNVVRASLLPFLRNHASHPSNKNLRPEDLDHRITILNKWWTGLFEVLDGRQNQTVSGVDRPILLEACYFIMTRPEWRLAPSHFAPLAERSPKTPNRSPERHSPTSRKKSSGSLSSSASQFMTESVYHNTRNLFIQNLLSQMSFVVDKMSLRHAPASLVTFCGKAAAYAFFFVPGLVEIMVRVWRLQADTLRRFVDGLGMPRRPNKVNQDEVIAPFPAHTHCLGWSSVKQMSNQLRQDPVLAVLAAKINWFGPWTARWCGRDSDLFFVFAKHYHVLAEEFMPAELPLIEKARAPGFVLVQAQLLSALDGTIHRQPAAEAIPITFDDVLAGADASAATLPMPSSNSARPMAENRLIMLLRDFISERPSEYENARITFAEAFAKLMQAAARRTSLFNHNACFVLCDFMDEALTIFVKFHHAHAHENDFIDWYFWMDVCKKMLDSENSMSEIRLFSFLFGAWSVITNDIRRKEVLCLEWLLSEETFDKFFNHWCPMVRAYFMRLLVWRMCRDDGEGSDLDTKIFCAVSTRVKSVWANYLFLKQHAEQARLLPPSIAPCYPAPGRRLLIVRNDNQAPAANLYFGFDGIVHTPKTQPPVNKRHSSLAGLIKLNGTSESNSESPKPVDDTWSVVPNKKRWTFMNKVLSSTATQESTPNEQPQIPNPTKTLEEARRETAAVRSRPILHSKSSSTDSETPPATSTHRAYCFKFSLEWAPERERPAPSHPFANGTTISNGNPARGGVGSNVGPERRICPPRLPSSAQAMLGAKVPGTSKEIAARDPALDGLNRVKRAKYSGRALAEWTLVVGECNNFVERRRSEGVPGLKWIEVPTLGVEGFRKFGGGW